MSAMPAPLPPIALKGASSQLRKLVGDFWVVIVYEGMPLNELPVHPCTGKSSAWSVLA